ncbi:uncharacterized protein B0T23DRAFT_427239 [Neurospora hispaniola]|uniref:Uncharacterized protein n=1 Tax=Neurospora hispaniola TaxID=588809 RepID=A0AAJ0I9J4_9PEZI|nr:hypothetical protein B0T23DRAFT_427239 [Neurospora hispaniola]
MPGYNRKWNPEEDDWPARSITFERLTERLDRKLPKHAEPTAIHREQVMGTDEYPVPSTHWIWNWQGKSISLNTVKGVEKICREEAERIGFKCVIIRSGVHAKTNQYAEDGTVLTEYNARTGTYTNVVADDDPHITVYMGFGLDQLMVLAPNT